MDLVHVVAGVLSDASGRILLARRGQGRDHAGAWEFPGGKLESGETPLRALARELQEELGIRVNATEPLISVPHLYPNMRIILDVYRVTSFSGVVRGCEQQDLVWSALDKLSGYTMPAADRPVVAALTDPVDYLITPEPAVELATFLQQLDRALIAGIRRVQLRMQASDSVQARRFAQAVMSRCDLHGAELLINGDIALAHTLGCGVHLRATQLLAQQKRPLPTTQRVAASCHNDVELRHAEAIGVDFVVLGPVQKTQSHPRQPPLGWVEFARLREQVSLPIYAIGGMRREDYLTARGHGAQGIAAIRGLWPTS